MCRNAPSLPSSSRTSLNSRSNRRWWVDTLATTYIGAILVASGSCTSILSCHFSLIRSCVLTESSILLLRPSEVRAHRGAGGVYGCWPTAHSAAAAAAMAATSRRVEPCAGSCQPPRVFGSTKVNKLPGDASADDGAIG
ncbi:hypothetical protein KC330_g108 [Hortaea werneckii]|nr:hypothetical protein KC330_g108 [Hortaea werneckii]